MRRPTRWPPLARRRALTWTGHACPARRCATSWPARRAPRAAPDQAPLSTRAHHGIHRRLHQRVRCEAEACMHAAAPPPRYPAYGECPHELLIVSGPEPSINKIPNRIVINARCSTARAPPPHEPLPDHIYSHTETAYNCISAKYTYIFLISFGTPVSLPAATPRTSRA